jgi:hypothetical protein
MTRFHQNSGSCPQIHESLQQSITRLLDYCQQNNWSGFDPFDGLSSRIFEALPLVQNRIGRLIFIQAMKRSPINFRPIFLVPKEENPKGLAVFCSALLILSKTGFINNDDTILHLLKRLIALKSKDTPYFCWGYNFDWQSRAFFLPKFVPNIICTTFAGNALLDAYDKFGDSNHLDMAVSAGNFLLEGLNITRADDEICFSYTPLDHGQVHNANLLGAAFLSRLYSLTQEKRFMEHAQSAVRYSVRRQNEDGSWPYGEDKTQRWIDNFHTGYNLAALKKFSESIGNKDFAGNIRKGFQFYKANLFTDDGLPKYFHNQLYPIDIHAVAESIMTLVEFKAYDKESIDLAKRIFIWSTKTMQNKDGYFYYQKKRYFINKIAYMRWSQAWMLLALSTLLEHCKQAANGTQVSASQMPQASCLA